MQNLVNEAPAKKNYQFIDAIRGIAMMSIVGEHSIANLTAPFPFQSAKYYTYIILIQLTKFGTVAFFLLAGFLISEKFADYSPGEYLKRRISTTFGPWVFWTFVYIVAMLINLRIKERIYHDGEFNLKNILGQIKILYLYTSYWFIINFLISISILLIFRRYLYSLYLGAPLLLFTLFYAVNIHYEWIDPRHTTAILGFVFFLWLGAQLRKNWEHVERWIKSIPITVLILAMLLTFGSCIYEIVELHNGSIDPFNTLRISNTLFSLVSFAFLLRLKTFKFVEYFKPRQTTYGIYLIHYILLVFLFPDLFMRVGIDSNSLPIPYFILYKAVTFAVLYLLTFGIVMLISNTRARKLIGN